MPRDPLAATKKKILALLDQGQADQAQALMAPVMCAPPDKKFLTAFARHFAASARRQPKRR